MKKYIHFVIPYAIYVSMVLTIIADTKYNFWQLFIFWIITLPLIVGYIAYIIWERKNKKNKGE
uniref:Oxidoreductase n=1 Tax=CrAss-like virus sp. ctcfK29 TaxID=2826827 RepID=A0A8S5MJ97_9CAUD|nr:MAG TPA: oxidoreductase [CrAss-like virus sp. ctcfK29]